MQGIMVGLGRRPFPAPACCRSTLGAVLFLTSLLPALAADAPNLVRNPGFEETANALPAAWDWGVGKDAKATLAIDTTMYRSGAASLRLASASPQAPHVYGTLCQRLEGLQPLRVYEVTFWARGDEVGACWFGGGSDWAQRVMFPIGTYDWRPISGQIVTAAAETHFDLRLNVDSTTRALWVDDVSVHLLGSLIPNGIVTHVAAAQLAAARVYPASRLADGSLTLDGDLGDWAGLPAPVLRLDGASARLSYTDYGGPADLSAEVRFAYDSEALYLAIEVTDDLFYQPVGGASAWWYDSVQLAFDPQCDRSLGAYASDDAEIGLTRGPHGDEVHAWSPDSVAAPAGVTLRTARRGPGGVTYEARVAWSFLDGSAPTHGRAFGVNLLLNDSDNDQRGYLEWTDGIGLRKDPASFATVLLVDPALAAEQPVAHLRLDRAVLYETDVLAATVWLAGLTPGTALPLLASIAGGAEFLRTEVEPEESLASVRLGAVLDGLAFGNHTVTVAAGARGHAEASFERSSGVSIARDLLDGVERDLPALEELLLRADAAKLPTDYQRLRWRVATLFVSYGRDDLDHGEIERAVRVGRALRTAIDQARDALLRSLAGTYRAPAVPHYRTGSIDIVGRSFIADTEIPSTGTRERRPVFFTGYGHFDQVREHLPILTDLGANIIQVENGPSSTLPAEDTIDPSGVLQHVGRALELGRDHHVAVCVLVSPHYFPDWAFKKWPALDCIRGGFVRHAIDAPEAKGVQAQHLGVLLPLIRDYPSLHSICLSNEPVYPDSHADPVTQGLWLEYLRRSFATPAAANAAWGTDFARLEDVPVPVGDLPEKEAELPLFYDWCRFNMERFAGWHAWEAGVVRSLAPGLPCHAKIMPTILERRTIGWGVDPELFARLSQVNGNDCWEFINRARTSPWAFNWFSMGAFYDLQCALAEKPVFNTENHIIVDRDQQPVPPEHTYTAIWQGAVHGQGATTTWVWQRTYDPKHDFAGSIMHRPENAIAHGEAGLDLMRLAREVTALQCAPRAVALLYAVTSIVHDPGYLDALGQAYTALNFTGLNLGFRSERQVAADDWGETRVLVLPRVRFVPPAVRAAIARWAEAGGRLVFVGEGCLARDPYRRPFVDSPAGLAGASLLPEGLDGAALRAALLAQLRQADISPVVTVLDAGGGLPWGVEWRAASLAGQPVVNLVNLTREPQAVRLGSGAGPWRDLIACQPLAADIVLAPMRPVLATSGPAAGR